MAQNDLRDLSPNTVAQLDTDMWKAYYSHQFAKLFVLLIRLTYLYFRPNYILTVRAAYHSASAAIIFRKTKGKENKKAILKHLELFYKLLSDQNATAFDYKKAAQLELEWWFVDRYPNKHKITRAVALADAMAVIYNIDAKKLTKYGKKRAQAMELIGEHHYNKKAIPDWGKIRALLGESYQSLSDTVTE